MIGKKIKDPEVKTRYRKIAEYIAAAKGAGEKLHALWVENCDTGTDDLDLAIREIEATQNLSNRTRKHKTYHLVISFRNEDEIPDLEILKEIERAYAKALGFEAHQRIVGTHVNTQNFHIHIGYNKIHPQTGNVHTPFRDFKALAEISMAMEQKYGLATDYGHAPDRPQQTPEITPDGKINPRAKDYEAVTWEESFESYVKRHKPELQELLEHAGSWRQFHEGAAEYGLRFKPRGNGLVIGDLNGKQRMKASTLGREFSKKAMEATLGPYLQPGKSKKSPARREYRPTPITDHPATKRLWRRYMGLRGGKAAPGTRAFRTFREFINAEALHDPLAMAMIIYQKKLINTLVGPGPKGKITAKPIIPDRKPRNNTDKGKGGRKH